jgi:alpha-galactosidase
MTSDASRILAATRNVLSFMAVLLYALAADADDRVSLATASDVSISRNASASEWTILNDALTFSVGFDQDSVLRVHSLADSSTGHEWIVDRQLPTPVTIDGQQVDLANRTGATLRFVEARAEPWRAGARLALIFSFNDRARVTRIFACYPHTPVIETWTEIVRTDDTRAVTLASPTAWSLALTTADIDYLEGLHANGDAEGFAIIHRHLEPGGRLEIGATERSTTTAMPWFVARADGAAAFGGLMWSGPWTMAFTRAADQTRIVATLPDLQTTIPAGVGLEVPHGFFGVVRDLPGAPASAMRDFLVEGLREGRGFQPLVTYNPWFIYGTRIDAERMRSEIEEAARLGIELFQLDAGWYPNTGELDAYDFTAGLGSWQVDAERFPGGLRPLADLAHERGMKFGVWVEPERVAISTVGEEGLARESWLAAHDGRYDPNLPNAEARAAQICLVHREAWQWVYDHLAELIESSGADYLKWDNNFWVNCNRSGHGHDSTDGAFAHVQATYELLAALRERFPDLIIENCSGGGNRIDFGMLRYSDVGWMDDRTSPSERVRHNLQGLSQVLPPAYLLSYVMAHESEPLHDSPDLPLLTRSRMPGILGLSYRAGILTEADERQLQREIDIYKSLRGITANASAALLSPQAFEGQVPPWEVVQHVGHEGDAVVFAFDNRADDGRVRFSPVGLVAEAAYEVYSVDAGVIGIASGESLMADGIEILASPNTGAHVLVLRRIPLESAPTNAARRP